jgi:deoxyadenosine/deoxycytidine kinase
MIQTKKVIATMDPTVMAAGLVDARELPVRILFLSVYRGIYNVVCDFFENCDLSILYSFAFDQVCSRIRSRGRLFFR